jgi:hypothetical protein
LNFVVKFASFGTEPEIFEISERRCKTCKVILTPGMKFNMLTVTIAAFFKLMPPVCRTFLDTQDGPPGPNAIFFDPLAKAKGTKTKSPASAALEDLKVEVKTTGQHDSSRTLPADGALSLKKAPIIMNPQPSLLLNLSSAAHGLCSGFQGFGFAFLTHHQPAEAKELSLQGAGGAQPVRALLLLGGVVAGAATVVALLRRNSTGL